ncbi:MAG: restriction endonuclease subunit S [Reyranella sp.]
MNRLPEGWAYTKLTDVAEKIGSGATPKGGRESYLHSGIPLVRSMNVHFEGFRDDGLAFLDAQQARKLDGVIVQESDVLLNITGASIGRVTAAPSRMHGARVNQHVSIIRLVNGIEPRFICLNLAAPEMQRLIVQENYGVTRPALTKSMIENFRIAVPPLPEQRRIVAKIDTLSGKSKRARDHLDHVPLLVRRYKQAILAASFRGDLTREWRVGKNLGVSIKDLEMRRKASWEREHQDGRIKGRYSAADPIDWQPSIQELPAGWVWASVDQITSLIQYGSSAKTSEASEGVAVMRMGNIQDGKLDFSSLKYLPNNHIEFPELLLVKGDVLFNRTNSAELVGKTAVYSGNPSKASFASYLIRLRCCGLLPQLLSSYINSSHGREWVASVVNQQVGQANVNGTKLKQLGIPVMPEAEQSEIVRRIEHAFTWIDRLAAEATSARKLVDLLDQAILAKAFRGELVPQDPSDEPASVLLDRIRSERASTAAAKPKHKAKK